MTSSNGNGHRRVDPWLYPQPQSAEDEVKAETAALEMRTLVANSIGRAIPDEELVVAAALPPSDAFHKSVLNAVPLAFDKKVRRKKERDRIEEFAGKLLAVGQWGGDVEGFIKHWRQERVQYREDSNVLEAIIELQHEGKSSKYITRYIHDRYGDD